MSEDRYEVTFHYEKLGFSVTNQEGTGTIIVNGIQDPWLLESVDLRPTSEEDRATNLVALMMAGGVKFNTKPLEPSQRIYLGDTVLAINGAPLGWVTDHQVARVHRPWKYSGLAHHLIMIQPSSDRPTASVSSTHGTRSHTFPWNVPHRLTNNITI